MLFFTHFEVRVCLFDDDFFTLTHYQLFLEPLDKSFARNLNTYDYNFGTHY